MQHLNTFQNQSRFHVKGCSGPDATGIAGDGVGLPPTIGDGEDERSVVEREEILVADMEGEID